MTVNSAHVEVEGPGFAAVIGFISSAGLQKFHHTRFEDYRTAVQFIEAHAIGMSEDEAVEVYEAFFDRSL